MTPPAAYLKTLDLIVRVNENDLTVAEIADRLRALGWTGEALEEGTIQAGLSALAVDMISTSSIQRIREA